MTRRRKSKTITGQRVPIGYLVETKILQHQANLTGKKLSKQDALRKILREWQRRK